MTATLLHPSSYVGIFAFLVLTGCGMPIPEEVAIVVAGVLSAEGSLLTAPALAACFSGAIVGDCVLYAIGYTGGPRLLRLHPRLAAMLGAQGEHRFERAIKRHALKVMLLSRFMVGIRGPAYLAAGLVRMPFRRFLLYDSLCATLVIGLFFSLAYTLGEDVAQWIRAAEWTASLLLLVLVIAIGGLLYYFNSQHVLRAIFGDERSPDS